MQQIVLFNVFLKNLLKATPIAGISTLLDYIMQLMITENIC
jgi:hypothetical protein